MKSLQALRSPAVPFTSFHDLPVFFISSSIVLRHVLFGLPLLLYPWGFQTNAVFSIAPASLRNVCPIQFHYLPFIWISIAFCLVILHSSSFVILSFHFISIIRLEHLFINVCNLLVIWLVVFQVSQAYNNTNFTFVLYIRILTPFDILWFLHTGYSWTNTQSAFLILLATSSSVPPFTDTTNRQLLTNIRTTHLLRLTEKPENCPLLSYYAAEYDKSLPTFRDNLSVTSSRIKTHLQEFLTLEDETDKLSRNVCKE